MIPEEAVGLQRKDVGLEVLKLEQMSGKQKKNPKPHFYEPALDMNAHTWILKKRHKNSTTSLKL